MKGKLIQFIGSFVILSICFVLLSYQQLYSSNKKPFLLKKTMPSDIEKKHKFISLVKHHTIPADFSKKFFFARPMELVVNENGNLYVYDDLLNKIIKFKSDYNFDKMFGKTGQGPGDFSSIRKYKSLGVFKNKIIVFDDKQNKLIFFSENGKFQKEIRFPPHINMVFPLITFRAINLQAMLIHSPDLRNNPKFDPNQVKITDDINYIVSGNMKGKAYVGKCNKDYNIIQYFLSKYDYYPFLVHLPDVSPPLFPDSLNTYVKVIPKSQIAIIYVANSSMLHIFSPNNSEKSFFIIPENQLKSYKNAIVKKKKKLKDNNFYLPFFPGFFLDQDNWKYIYFTGRSYYGNDKKYLLYKYDLQGNLVSILYHFGKHRVDFMAKKNGCFYSIDRWSDEIKIFKEKNHE